MAVIVQYHQAHFCNSACTTAMYRYIGTRSDCLLLQSLRDYLGWHLHLHLRLMHGTGKLFFQLHKILPFVRRRCWIIRNVHLVDNCINYPCDFGHSSPLSRACCPSLCSRSQPISRSYPISLLLTPNALLYVLTVADP